jgi:MFS family permease
VRLVIALLIGSIGGVGMWAIVVMIPAVQAEFAATRGAVSLAFTLMMFGFGLGGVIAGKITDRFGIVPAMAISIAFLGVANVLAGLSGQLWQFVAAYFLIGLGTSATFAPLMAEASHWFERYRGLAVTIVASGNYFAGTMWPPIVSWGMQSIGWRHTHIGIGLVCVGLMTILVLVLRAQMGHDHVRDHANAPPPRVDLKLSTNTLTVLLSIASISCCVAMAMPQVHIVAYCGDLGYGVARGAEMLSLMMACGIVSRIGSGFLADKIGGVRTLLVGSLALPDLRDVRPVPGRDRAELRHHRARGDARRRGGDARRHRDLRLGVRHVLRRLGVGRHLRCHRLVCCGIREWRGLERDQYRHRRAAADPLADGFGQDRFCDLNCLSRL